MPTSPRTLDRIRRAQATPTVRIGDETYQRLAFGNLEGGHRCRACSASYGQLHALNCVAERCPRCRVGQALTCTCHVRTQDEPALDEEQRP